LLSMVGGARPLGSGAEAPGTVPGGVVDGCNDHGVESVPLNLAASTRRPRIPS
jgi:hypothetical protein